ASPLTRAVQTAEAFGMPVEIDHRWIELDYGEYDGLPLRDIAPETWERWRLNIHFRPPGGETVAELGHRVRRSLEELQGDAQHRHVVVVSHVSPIKAALAWALGTSDVIAWRCFLDPASVTRIETGPNGAVVVRFNDTAHLAGLDDSEQRRTEAMEGWSRPASKSAET
ncbi:MAG: histidine phosphatase family protein, partial [Acidimicrobiales bacterium]|nr:histidine phosphatase family protein [Acidimicrobiales bacterium]